MSSDKEAEGWVHKFLPKLLANGVTSLKKAKELIEDSGDLREWQIPKQPAKQLFAALEELEEGGTMNLQNVKPVSETDTDTV